VVAFLGAGFFLGAGLGAGFFLVVILIL